MLAVLLNLNLHNKIKQLLTVANTINYTSLILRLLGYINSNTKTEDIFATWIIRSVREYFPEYTYNYLYLVVCCHCQSSTGKLFTSV